MIFNIRMLKNNFDSFFLHNLVCKLAILYNGEVLKKFIIEHYFVWKKKKFCAMFYFI